MPTYTKEQIQAEIARRRRERLLTDVRIQPDTQLPSTANFPIDDFSGLSIPLDVEQEFLNTKIDIPNLVPQSDIESVQSSDIAFRSGIAEQTPSIRQQEETSFFSNPLESIAETGASILGGITQGLGGGDFSESSSVLGKYINDKSLDESSTFYTSKIGGEIGSFLPALRVTRAFAGLPLISKIALKSPKLLNIIARGTTEGAIYGLQEEAIGSARGEEFNAENIGIDAAIFGALEGSLHGVGRLFKSTKKLLKKGKGESMAEALGTVDDYYKRATSESKLTANKTTVPLEKNYSGVAPEKPAVTNEVRDKVLSSPDSPIDIEGGLINQGKALLKRFDRIVETAPRMFERLGLKEEIYRPWLEKNNEIATVTDTFNKGFTNKVKEMFPDKKARDESSKRIATFAISVQPGGKRILENMGVEVPVLTAQEEYMYSYMREMLKREFIEQNEARLASGLRPFKETQAYFTFWRKYKGDLESGFDPSSVLEKKINLGTTETSFRMKNKRFSDEKTKTFAEHYNVGRKVHGMTDEEAKAYAKKQTSVYKIYDEYGEVELDAFNTFQKYVNTSIRSKKLNPLISYYNEILNGEFKDGISLKVEKPTLHREISSWVDAIAGRSWVSYLGDDAKKSSILKIENGLNLLRQNMAASVLGFNFRTMLIQPTAFINTTTEIGPKYAMQGLKDLLSGTAEAIEFAVKRSNHLKSRNIDVAMEQAYNTAAEVNMGKIRKAQEFSLGGLKWLDNITAVASWLGAYRKAIDKLKYSEKEAINYADDVVIGTQGSGAAGDISPIQRSVEGKFGTMFQTFVINNWGFLSRDVLGLGKDAPMTKENYKKVATYLVGASMMNVLFEDVLGTRSPFPAPLNRFQELKDKGNSNERATIGAVSEFYDFIPVFGGSMRYGSSPVGAGVETVAEVAGITRGDKSIDKVVEILTRLSGIPGGTQARKLIRDLEE